jgi:hypothetical protein
MADSYTIYVVNQSADLQTFWCFLAKPVGLDDEGVYANSSASIVVEPNYSGVNKFTIPVQYVLGVGAKNDAVGLNVQVESSNTRNAALNELWEANYFTPPPSRGPNIAKTGTSSATTIAIETLPFDKTKEKEARWYSNQSFGIQTEAGFIGMTWSPSPKQVRTITPRLSFYVATGDFGSNQLASWTQVSVGQADVVVPDNFSGKAATVTYLGDGSWSVTSGPPPVSAFLDLRGTAPNIPGQQLAALSLSYLPAEALEQAALTYASLLQDQIDTVDSVTWQNQATDLVGDPKRQIGSMLVKAAAQTGFAYFVCSGVKFNITGLKVGSSSVDFSYDGEKSAGYIHGILKAGAQIVFGGGKG